MKVKIIERLLFKLRGMSVPVVRVADIDEHGRIGTIQFVGHVKKRPNSLVQTWDGTGWEIQKDTHQVTIVNEKGVAETGYVVQETGSTSDIFTTRSIFPNLERVIGAAATLDDIPDSLDLGKSMRNLLLGILIAAPLWWIVFKIIGLAR